MKSLLLTFTAICISLISFSQELEVKKCTVQDLGNNTAIVSISFKGEVITEFKEVKMIVTGQSIAQGEYTFVAGNPVISGKKNGILTLTGKVKLSENINTDSVIEYKVMDNGITGFRKLTPGQALYFPPIEKKP